MVIFINSIQLIRIFLITFLSFIFFIPGLDRNYYLINKSTIGLLNHQPKVVQAAPQFAYFNDLEKDKEPVQVIIPSAGIDVNVKTAHVVDGYWETSTDSASFGWGTAYPEENGNTVIFAHAQKNLFANLNKVRKNDKIYLFTENKYFEFQAEDIQTVTPDKVDLVSNSPDEKILTLYTCTGYKDRYRLVVKANKT